MASYRNSAGDFHVLDADGLDHAVRGDAVFGVNVESGLGRGGLHRDGGVVKRLGGTLRLRSRRLPNSDPRSSSSAAYAEYPVTTTSSSMSKAGARATSITQLEMLMFSATIPMLW